MKKWWLAAPICLLLSGCWDQRMLKDLNLIFGVGLDVPKEDHVALTLEVPEEGSAGGSSGGSSGGSQQEQVSASQIVTENARTVRESTYQLDRRLGGILDISKLRVVLVGRESAEKDIYPLLDPFYREPVSPLNAKIAVVEGKAETFFQNQFKGHKIYSEYFFKMIETAEQESIAPITDLQLACILLLDDATDAVLPLMSYDKKDQAAKMDGAALFNDRKMAGTLKPLETSAFLLLAGQKGRELPFTIQTENGYMMTVLVEDSKRKMKVHVSEQGKASVDISLRLEAGVIEYPPNDLDDPKKLARLSKNLSHEMNKYLVKTMKKMQKANSDALGIGRRVLSKNPAQFKQMDWKKTYPEIEVKIDTKVEITGSGSIL
ncbi:Ger(x)C family spore germination protein [Domibacillus tundrae]|uniref:Ger(x)C family spore germination protein n=1 Tax=Domibacillus tundrae TaxID=1587527 RepID=UPI000617BCBF|nr:Ger(x)C family spore germination protein [Domibacillus tundrae]